MKAEWTSIFGQPAKVSVVNVMHAYRKITEEFVKYYYTTYDNNFINLGGTIKRDTKITYMDEEMIGFNKLCERLSQYNIRSFKHYNMHVISQPLNAKSIIMTVTGEMTANESIYRKKFIETIVIQRAKNNNNFNITNLIFRLIE